MIGTNVKTGQSCHFEQSARPARPGATALALMSVPIIPVWARGATRVTMSPLALWGQVWAREKSYGIEST